MVTFEISRLWRENLVPIDILSVDLDENLVVFRAHGELAIQSLLDHRNEVTSQSWYSPTMDGIYCFENIVAPMSLIHMQEQFRKSKPLVRKVALVIDPNDYITMNAIQIYVDLTREESSSIKLCTSVESAREWLGLPVKN